MKFTLRIPWLATSLFASFTLTPLMANDSWREHLSLDEGWKFHLGDDWPGVLRLDKAGASGGPAAEKFSDISWRPVSLPHDWAIELPFDSHADGTHGFKALGASFPNNSVGWYRRSFEVNQADQGKRIWLTFDGVMHDATVWVNGWIIKRHQGGYYPFREDITDVLHYGKPNVIAVRVDATPSEGWFYEGAGIYRHVWLDKTAPIAIAPDGVSVATRFANNVPEGDPNLAVEVTLLNSATNTAKAMVHCEILSPEGRRLKEFSSPGELKPKSSGAIVLESPLSAPALWTPETPKLYTLVTSVSVGGKIIDQKETVFGIRTVAFDPEKGFLLNGKPYRLQGTCNHQDHAGVGAAIPDALQEFRVKKLKELGCNAIRTSHNPPTPELLDACDHLGMLIMDESRLLGSDSENLRKWDDQIRRDRNHPCVAIWSVANEEFSVQGTAEGGNVAATMQDYVKRLDPTRPVTYAAPEGNSFAGINRVIEVRGWNYHIGHDMEDYHAKHPGQANVGTEQASTVTTRGIYEKDAARGYVSAYGTKTNWSNLAEEWWGYFEPRPWLSGGFVWTGFDYRGEPTPYWWPCINSHFGILDMCGFWKDIAWYYQAWWTNKPVLHLLPHWNWPGREGQEIQVDALSNCKQVELFLNDNSLGKQAMQPNSKLTWRVKYAPGTLSAKGFDDAGKVIAESKVETTGGAVQVALSPDRKSINADGQDVSVITVAVLDAQGRAVPVAQNKISFSVEGPGKILGVGNGDPSCHEPDVFQPVLPAHTVPVNNWHWKLAAVPEGANPIPEYAPDFDDSSWETIRPKTDGDTGDLVIKKENTTAVFRAHFKLTEEDLAKEKVMIRFAGCDDAGWYFINNQFVGETRDWQAQPIFDIKKAVHAGDNVVSVGVKNFGGTGGLNPDVNVEVIGKATASPWSRSLFNGLAQIIVQSAREPGEVKLTATAEGLNPATAIIETQPCKPRPAVP